MPASPAKKKSRVSFETSTPIRVEENNHVENNNDCSISDEPKTLDLDKLTKKKKSKKKNKDKDLANVQESLIANMLGKFKK